MRDWMKDDELLVTRLLRRSATDGDRLALWTRDDADWRVRSWHEIAADVARAAATLGARGVRPGSVVAQVAANSYSWIIADLALLGLGAVHVPLHTSLGAAQIESQIRHSGAHWTIVADEGGAAKVRVGDVVDARTLCKASDESRGRALLEEAAGRISLQTPATILYTSGTLGDPKGVVLSQGNLLANTRSVLQAFVEREQERRLCVLPLSHIYARTCDLYVWLVNGTEMALAARPETLREDLRTIQPTFANGVPYFFDRVRRQLDDAGVADKPGVLRAALGGKIELCVCGGAVVPDVLYDYFLQQGVPLLPGYGLTEASPVVTASTASMHQRGFVGRPLPGVEVRLAADGEILTRGPHVMLGYHRDAAATAAALRDGWLHTGDLGAWNEQGLLRIAGRKKDVLVLATGKNVAPTPIEQRLTEDPWIAQAAVVGDGRNCLVALIVPRAESLAEVTRSLQLGLIQPSELPRHPAVTQEYARRIAACLGDLAPHEQVRAFQLLDRPFSLEHGECTPKLTLCRARIEARFATEIEALYAVLAHHAHAPIPLALTPETSP